jgi:heptosyltransferase-2
MSERILICGVNWLGDSIMSMPAVRLLKQHEPAARITMFVRAPFVPLWQVYDYVDEVVAQPSGLEGMSTAIGALRAAGFQRAYVFPNSFRSAVFPFAARIPVRVGAHGHQRAWMLTGAIGSASRFRGLHQAWEYLDIVGMSDRCQALECPRLTIPELTRKMALRKLGDVETAHGWIGLIPGAAHGPSKRWPAESFALVGRKLSAQTRCRVAVFGTVGEVALGAQVAAGVGAMALNLSGETTLPELAALLRMCRVVITNDSGGMHLAAAAGACVVAIFGLTDPAKTGPLGTGHKVLTAGSARVSRDIKPHSAEAVRCLRSITPETVCDAAMEVMTEDMGEKR